MALSSSSTLDDALAQYNDNLNYDGDVAKAGNALAAIRWILVNRPQIVATNDRNINFESLLAERKQLESFISTFGSGVTRASFVRGRMLT